MAELCDHQQQSGPEGRPRDLIAEGPTEFAGARGSEPEVAQAKQAPAEAEQVNQALLEEGGGADLPGDLEGPLEGSLLDEQSPQGSRLEQGCVKASRVRARRLGLEEAGEGQESEGCYGLAAGVWAELDAARRARAGAGQPPLGRDPERSPVELDSGLRRRLGEARQGA